MILVSCVSSILPRGVLRSSLLLALPSTEESSQKVRKGSTHRHDLGGEVLLQEALDSHVCVAPGAPENLPKAADAYARAQGQLVRLYLPLRAALCTNTSSLIIF